MKMIKFLSNKDIMRGIRTLSKLTPLILINGDTYVIPNDYCTNLDNAKVGYTYVNGSKNIKLMDEFKDKIINES